MMQYDPEKKQQILDTKLELGMTDRLKTKEEIAGSKLLNERADKRPDSGADLNKYQYHYPVQSVTCIKFAKNGNIASKSLRKLLNKLSNKFICVAVPLSFDSRSVKRFYE